MKEDMIGREISGCETLIMKIIWDSETDISTPELIDALSVRFDKHYARTTVVTFLQRLAEKGFVKTYRKGRVSYVHAIREEQEFTDKFLREADEFWFHGNTPRLVSALCKAKKMEKKEIDQIRKILDEMDD